MSRILLKQKDNTYKQQDNNESEHTITKFLFLDDLDIECNKERSQRKE